MASIFSFLIRHLKIIVVVFGVVLMILTGLVVSFLQPENMLMRQQEVVLNAVEKRSGKILLPMLAADYEDQWDFTRDDASLALGEVGSQFIFLSAESIDPIYEIEENTAVVTMGIHLKGNGGPLAHEVMRRANKLKEPFVFYWKKEGKWPWSWKISRIENPSLPKSLYGYRPGKSYAP